MAFFDMSGSADFLLLTFSLSCKQIFRVKAELKRCLWKLEIFYAKSLRYTQYYFWRYAFSHENIDCLQLASRVKVSSSFLSFTFRIEVKMMLVEQVVYPWHIFGPAWKWKWVRKRGKIFLNEIQWKIALFFKSFLWAMKN